MGRWWPGRYRRRIKPILSLQCSKFDLCLIRDPYPQRNEKVFVTLCMWTTRESLSHVIFSPSNIKLICDYEPPRMTGEPNNQTISSNGVIVWENCTKMNWLTISRCSRSLGSPIPYRSMSPILLWMLAILLAANFGSRRRAWVTKRVIHWNGYQHMRMAN